MKFCFLIALSIVTLSCGVVLAVTSRRSPERELVPAIDGPWWQVAGDPDVGQYTSPKQEPVDFCIWQAADGTWQLWSCVRGTKHSGNARLLYGWEGKHITDPNWIPQGIKMEADTNLGEALQTILPATAKRETA